MMQAGSQNQPPPLSGVPSGGADDKQKLDWVLHASSEHSDQISDLKEKVDSVGTDVSSIQSDIGRVQSDIGALGGVPAGVSKVEDRLNIAVAVLLALLAVFGWGALQLYDLNATTKVAETRLEVVQDKLDDLEESNEDAIKDLEKEVKAISKKLDESDRVNRELLEKMNRLLETSEK
ncbi:MAG: hypothetical protein CMH98_04655 [Oceanospirillaceae bacterium]|nr:hypothetical protein [Oceanospirillaceae bacterium]